MHRNQLLILLDQYAPVDREERVQKQNMVAFVKEQPRCFDRSLEIGHITASAWLLDKTGLQVLLTHHKKFDCWLQLGGHCDGNPDVLAVAIKEAQEESGINDIRPVVPAIFDVDVHYIPPKGSTPAHRHYDVRFLLQVASDESFVVSSESNDLRWVAQNDPALFSDNISMMRMFQKWKARNSCC